MANQQLSLTKDFCLKQRTPPQKTKKWNISHQRNKGNHQNFQTKNHEQIAENINNIRQEIARLEELNNKYEKDFQHERKILFFNLYEKQYLLDTKWHIGPLNMI